VADSVYTDIPQLRELLRDLDAIDEEIGRAVREAIAAGAEPILRRANTLAPFDPLHRGHRKGAKTDPGHIRDSLYLEPAPGGARLRTTHPGAPVHHWGGTIAPRGTAITIRAKEFASKAGREVDITDHVAREIDRLLAAHNL
jgi:phage gpG-like protein